MKYYVIYAGKDVGWYKTSYWVVAVVTNKDIAEDFCNKFDCRYTVEEVGKDRETATNIKLEPAKEEER